jgi:hypothetical protein
MALQPCYECNKKISTKAIMCPQCGAPQNPASGLMDKAKGFLLKKKESFMIGIEEARKEKELQREKEEIIKLEDKLEWNSSSPAKRKIIIETQRKNYSSSSTELTTALTELTENILSRKNDYAYEMRTKENMTDEETRFYEILDFEDRLDFDFGGSISSLKDLETHNLKKYIKKKEQKRIKSSKNWENNQKG